MQKTPAIRRTIVSIIAIVMMVSLFSTTASAASNVKFTWYQTSSWISTTKTFNGNTGQITFEGVATSPNLGTFKVKLQKQGFLGIWSNVGNVYTVSQHPNSTYNVRTEKSVNGQYFKLYWHSQDSGTYRFVLEDASKPQVTVISQAYYW